jgi:hypothetical protein
MSEKQVKRYKRAIRKAVIENKRVAMAELVKLIKTFTFRQRLVIALDILKARKVKDERKEA